MESVASRHNLTPSDVGIEEQAAAWFLRLSGDDCTDEVRQEFDAWLARSERHEKEYRAFQRLWRQLDSLSGDRTKRKKQRKHASVLGVLVAVSLGIGLLLSGSRQAVVEQTISTGIGEIRRTTLSDGTDADINADSRLVVAFANGARRIRVERGEAVFSVAPDLARPFEVSAGTGVLKDIGTTFGVALANDQVSVNVIEGAVEISIAQENDRVIVVGGEQSRYSADKIARPERFDVEAATAWRSGRFVFRDTPLGEVIRQLNMHHERPTRLDDLALERLRVSGVFNTADRDGLLSALETLYPISRDETVDATRLILKRR
jgi:transmembrane sensor